METCTCRQVLPLVVPTCGTGESIGQGHSLNSAFGAATLRLALSALLTTDKLLRILIEFGLTTRGAKIIFLTFVLRSTSRLVLINFHSTNRIYLSCHNTLSFSVNLDVPFVWLVIAHYH